MADRQVGESPHKGKAHVGAYNKGRKARGEGKPEEACPYGDYPARSFRTCWLAGWKDEGLLRRQQHQTRVPKVQTQDLAIAQRGNPKYWLQEDQSPPSHYRKPIPVPCVRCKRIMFEGSDFQAVTVRDYSEDRTVVTLRCRSCHHVFQMPVR